MAEKAFTVADSRKYTLFLCKLVGFDVFIQKVPRTIIYYLCFWVNTSYHVFCIYTFIKYRHDLMIVLQCLSVWGAAGQCSVKTFLALIYRKTMRKAFDSLIERQDKSEEDPAIYARYLKWSKRLNIIQRTIFYVLNNNIILLSLYVILSIVIFNERKHLLVCNIPGLPFDTNAPFPSYEIHIFYQFIALVAGVYELIVLDGLFAFFVCNAAAMAETLLVMAQRMANGIERNELTDDATTERIKELVFLHREYMDYVYCLDTMYSTMLLMQFGSFALSGSVALFVGGSSDWFAIYGVVLTSFTQLFFYNLLGTILQTKNQQIKQQLFETNWIKMCEKNKRYILLMLQRSQTMTTITVGHLAPLNLETGMSIYKVLYSYFLLLKDVFNNALVMASRAFTVGEGREYLLKRCSFMGLDVLVRDGKKNIIYYLSFWVPTFYQICCFYSFYLLGNDTVTILQCLTIWGAAGQCNIKVTMAYIYRKSIRQIFEFVTEKHNSIENDPEIKSAFEKWGKRHYLIQRLYMYVLNTNMVMLSSYAILSFAIYHQRKFLVICYIPGLNPDPNAGFPDYEIQTAIHLICLFVGINELVALDGIFTYFIFNAASMADALIIYLRRMSLLLSQDSLSDAETTKYIRYLSKLHQEYVNYVNRLDRMYNLMLLMNSGSFAISGSVGLYAAQISDWYAVYGIVFCSVFQLFFFCSLGSVIENKNIEISEEFYLANWTAMSVKNRRMMLFMIQRAKTVDTISVGHLSPLNLETGMSTYKILYSYFLLLQDAIKA